MHTSTATQSVKVKPRILWWGIGLAVADWMFETVLHMYILGEGSFAENFFPHDTNELWMRTLIMSLIIGSSYVADIFLSRQRQMAEHTARLNRLLTFLSEVNQRVQRLSRPKEMFEGICNAAVKLGGFRFAWVGMHDKKASGLKPVAKAAFSKLCQKAVDKAGIGPIVPCAMALQAITEGKSAHCMVLKNTSCKAAWKQPLIECGCRSAAAFPILVQGKTFGSLSVYAGDSGFFHDQELAILEEAADDISFALTTIENEKQQKQAKAELQEREHQIRLLLDSTAEAIYGLDLDGNCTFANPSCLKLLGYEGMDDVLDKNMHDLIHHTRPDGSPYPEQECRIYEAFQKGEGTHVDDEVLWRKDGTNFAAEYWSYPVTKDGKITGSVVTFLDITERNQAEENLRHRLNELERFQKATTDREFRIKELREEIKRLKGGKGKDDE